MADISNNLRILYGLSRIPTSIEVDRWVQLTEAYIRQGFSTNEAGNRAAAQTLPGVGTRVLASQADTVEMLLNKAKGK